MINGLNFLGSSMLHLQERREIYHTQILPYIYNIYYTYRLQIPTSLGIYDLGLGEARTNILGKPLFS